MTHRHHDAVVALMRRVGADIVMPRFRNLAADQVEEKATDDLVTIADRESEAALTEGLMRIDLAVRVIGEEAVAADATLLDGIGSGAVWIVDPIDGTNNYASGTSPFGIMIALVEDGVTQAGWILDPVTGRLCHATSGGGCFIDGKRVFARVPDTALPVAGIASYHLSNAEREALSDKAAGTFAVVPMPRCAAEQYPRLIGGINHIALFQKTLPWDHAPGSLMLREAGGVVRWADGVDYSVGRDRPGLIAAASVDLWEQARTVLFA